MKKALIVLGLVFYGSLLADDGYKIPPKAIADLVDAPITPNVRLSPDKKHLLILERTSLPSIEELSQPELRLAGLRINPMTNGRSRANSYKGILIQNIKSGKQKKVKGLPKNAKISNVSWSPDSKRIAMSVINGEQINLYLSETKTGKAKLLIKKPLNTIYGSAFYWLSDSKSLIIKAIIDNRGNPPKLSNIPSGPILQENLGKVSPARTYQDLLTSPYDEDLFDYYMTAQVLHVDIKGKMKKIGKPGVIRRAEPSPDGKYILSERIHRPYSYLVPVYRFPNLIQILDIKGNLIHTLRDMPLAESIPIGRDAVISGPRSFAWRSDVGSTIYYVNALDEGNPNIDVPYRDELFSLSSPFANTEPKSLIKLELRYSNVRWGDKNMALVSARKWTERRTTMWHLNPSNNKSKKIIDRSYEDRYNDPGSPIMETNKFGRSIVALIGDQKVFMAGNGASPDGDLPFIDEFDIKTNKSKRLWRCKAPYYEVTVNVIDKKKNLFLTRRESKDEPPNYLLRGLKDNS